MQINAVIEENRADVFSSALFFIPGKFPGYAHIVYEIPGVVSGGAGFGIDQADGSAARVGGADRSATIALHTTRRNSQTGLIPSVPTPLL